MARKKSQKNIFPYLIGAIVIIALIVMVYSASTKSPTAAFGGQDLKGLAPEDIPIDSPPDVFECGDGVCTYPQETNERCPQDCPESPVENYTCGDGACEVILENYVSCPDDCEPYCGDGYCTNGESELDCPADCTIIIF